MAMWRQRTAPPLNNNNSNRGGLTALDPNASRNNNNNNNPNLSKQSLDYDRSESFLSSSHHQQQMQQQFVPSSASSSFMAPGAGGGGFGVGGVSMPTAHVSTAPPQTTNHRDRFQMYLERYAPNHPETALRRAQLITSTTQHQVQQQQQNQEQQAQYQNPQWMMMSESQMAATAAAASQHHNNNNNNNESQYQQHQYQQQQGTEQHRKEEQEQEQEEQEDVGDAMAAHSAAVLDIQPERLRFELCASRSESDQLRRRIVTLQRMNEHLRDKLEQTLLSEREQAVRANSIESHDRSLHERLADAESEVRELKRRLGESQATLSQTETKLAQCRGRLAAFDHIAASDHHSQQTGGRSGGGVNDSVSELVQTLSTSHYLLSVTSTLRFLFSAAQQQHPHSQQQQVPISVHVGGGAPPMQVSNQGQAVEALQALVCGNRETANEMRTRVVGWTPDDMLREIRSVVMTAETMVVRLLTDGMVGSMIRNAQQQQSGNGSSGGEEQDFFMAKQQQQQQQPKNLIGYLAPEISQKRQQQHPQPQPQPQQHVAPQPRPVQQNQQQRQQQPEFHDPMQFENTPVHHDARSRHVLEQNRLHHVQHQQQPQEFQEPEDDDDDATPQQQQQQQQVPHQSPPSPAAASARHTLRSPNNSRQGPMSLRQADAALQQPSRNVLPTYDAAPSDDGNSSSSGAAAAADVDDSGVARLRSSFDPQPQRRSEKQQQQQQEEDPCKVQ